jgi:6-phosphogluconolactonase
VELDLAPDPAALARAFAAWVAARLRHHVHERGRCAVAFSGGSTPNPSFAALAAADLPWDAIHVFQVDERVAPDGDPDRNATALRRELLDRVAIPAANVHLMRVGDMDPAEAAAAYEAELRDVCDGRLDVVHLGLGDDGHTASWPPGDAVIHDDRRDVAVVGPFNGRMRVTLTPRCVNRAPDIAFLVSGGGKREVLEQLMVADPAIPAGAVREEVIAFVDRAAFE